MSNPLAIALTALTAVTGVAHLAADFPLVICGIVAVLCGAAWSLTGTGIFQKGALKRSWPVVLGFTLSLLTAGFSVFYSNHSSFMVGIIVLSVASGFAWLYAWYHHRQLAKATKVPAAVS